MIDGGDSLYGVVFGVVAMATGLLCDAHNIYNQSCSVHLGVQAGPGKNSTAYHSSRRQVTKLAHFIVFCFIILPVFMYQARYPCRARPARLVTTPSNPVSRSL